MPLAAFPKCYLDDLATGRMPVSDWIDMAASLAVDGLELYWGFVPPEPQARAALRARIEARGLTAPMMCYSPDFTKPDAGERAEEVRKAEAAMRATRELGGRYFRVLSGQRRPGVTVENGIGWAARCIMELLALAQELSLVLILENHYKDGFWQYPELAQRSADFLLLLSAIPPSPWFGVNFDPSNALIAGEDPLGLLDAVLPRVVTMHASDRTFEGGNLEDLQRRDQDPVRGYAAFLKHGVVGRGANDYDAIFSRLRSAGFRGWISIEDGDDPANGMENLKESATFLRLKMREYGLP